MADDLEALLAKGEGGDSERPSFLDKTEPRLASKTSVAGPGLGVTPGLVEPGNIDLTNRPSVLNKDGSHSSVRSMSFSDGGPEILVPTVPDDGSHIMSDDEAIAQYRKTGRHLGKFSNPTFANAYADRLHRQQAAAGGNAGSAAQVPGATQQGDDLEALLAKGEAHVSTKPAAPFIPERPPTFGESARAGLGALARPFLDINDSVIGAGRAVGHAAAHPVDTFQGSLLARALGASTPEAVARHAAEQREVMRGVNSNIPLANRAVESLGGPPALSAEDAAAAPGARDVGSVAAAAPVGEMLGGIAGAGMRGAQAVGEGARTLGENSIARSAKRGATPIKDALLKVGDDALEKGHLTAPLVRAGAVATDETVAALARRLIKSRGAPAALAAEEAAPIAARAAEEPPAPPVSDNPQIAQLQDALKTASPEQADMINKAIAGIEARAKARPRAPAPPSGEAPLAPSLAERAQAIKESRSAPSLPAANPSPDISPARPVEAPKWQASKFDDKYARKLKMTPEAYRDMMNQRLAEAQKTLSDPKATPAAKARAVQIARGTSNVPEPGDELEAAQ